MSSAGRADLEAMMADLGNGRLEQLATENASRSRQGVTVNRQRPSAQPFVGSLMQSTRNPAENPGANRWIKAVNEGAFHDDDYRTVKNLDSIDDGNAHRRSREPTRGPIYDPANPLGPRGNPGRTYPSSGQAGRYSELPTPVITHGVGRGAPALVRGVTRQTMSPAGRGRGILPSAQNPATTAAGHGRGRGRGDAASSVLSTSQGLVGARPGVAASMVPRSPPVVVSQHVGGVKATSGMNVVVPNGKAKEPPINKAQVHEDGVAKKANELVDATFIPPHLRHRETPLKEKARPTSHAPEQKVQGKPISKNVAPAIAPPSDHSQIVYHDDDTNTSLIVGMEREGVRSTVTLYIQPGIDTVFWEVRTKSLVLRGDIRYCIAPLVLGGLVYFRRQEGKTAGVENCYIQFSSIPAAEKFKTALNFHRDKHANSTGEIFKETSEDLDEVKELSAEKTPSISESPKTEMSGQTVVEDLIDLDNIRSSARTFSRPDDLQEPWESTRPAAVLPTSSHSEAPVHQVMPSPTEHSGSSALPVIADIATHDNEDAKQESNYEEYLVEDSSYEILGHSVEMIEKIPAGKHLSRESLRVLANLTKEDYRSMNADYLSKVLDFRAMLPSTSTMHSDRISMTLKRMALNVAARWLWMDPSFTSLRFDEQKKVCAVVYTNVNHRKKRIVRPLNQLIELRPSLTHCRREVVEFNEFLRMDGLDKKYNPGTSSIDWDRNAESVIYTSRDTEAEKKRKEEEPQRAEAENKRKEEQKKQEAMKSASSLTHNRTLHFLLDNELSFDNDNISGQTNSQRVPAPTASSGYPKSTSHRAGSSPEVDTLPKSTKSGTAHPHDSGLSRESSSSRASRGGSHATPGKSSRTQY